jgi:Meiotically up-regulated gene 113
MTVAGNAWRKHVVDGYIYFIRAGRTNKVKIGYAKNPYKRLDGMQVGSPHHLYLIGYCPGTRDDEFDWHREWQHLHTRGEWFTLAQDLRDAINAKLSEAVSTRYIHVKTDWRNLLKQGAQFHQPKRPAFIDGENFAAGTKSGTSWTV